MRAAVEDCDDQSSEGSLMLLSPPHDMPDATLHGWNNVDAAACRGRHLDRRDRSSRYSCQPGSQIPRGRDPGSIRCTSCAFATICAWLVHCKFEPPVGCRPTSAGNGYLATRSRPSVLGCRRIVATSWPSPVGIFVSLARTSLNSSSTSMIMPLMSPTAPELTTTTFRSCQLKPSPVWRGRLGGTGGGGPPMNFRFFMTEHLRLWTVYVCVRSFS